MLGYRFTEYIPETSSEGTAFDNLLKIFLQLLIVTSGNVAEALQWLTNLDKKYKVSSDQYGIGDFIEDLKTQGYLTEDNEKGGFKITPKSEQKIRKSSLEEIFGKLKKTSRGNHSTTFNGQGDEQGTD
ncbi:MAG: hypothetical protein M3421_13890, partial [Bacteroidota bacterium]|nr:hypothetical protein [Bacteroidota bacterium]